MTLAPPQPVPAVAPAPAIDSEAGHPYRPYRTTLLKPGEVRALSVLRPHKAVLDTTRCWTLIVVAWVAVALWPVWWVVLAALPVIGTQYYGLFIIGHDGMHRRIFRRTAVNDLFTDLLILGPIGAITRINNRNHLGHHRHLCTEDDPDRHKHVTADKDTRPKYVAFLSGLASLYPAVKNVFIGGDGHADAPRRGRNYTVRDIVILAGWQVALIGGLTLAVGWWAFPVLWLLPVYVFMYLGDLVRSFAEHSHPEPDDVADEHRLVTFLSNRLERIFFAPMNMNYHAAHHLWPSIPYYNLPAADWLMRRRPGTEGMHWRGSYLAYLWTWFETLPQWSRAEAARHEPPVFGPAIATEPVPACPVCGGPRHDDFTVGRDYEYRTCNNDWRLVRCDDCAHVWLNPRPAVRELDVIYPPDYYAYHYESRISPIALRAKGVLDSMRMKSILRACPASPRSFLDVGCGTGRFLRAMRDRGLDPSRIWGIELDEQVVAYLRAEGFQARCERVEDCDAIEPGSLDLVTMFHVIEHVDDPGAVIERIAGWLAPGGVFALETPNLDSQDARWFHDAFWGGYHFPRHFNLFTPGTLRRLCRDRGLEPVTVRYQTGHSFWMYSMHHVLKYGPRPRPGLARRFDPLSNVLPLAAFTAYDKARALVGARTSAMLMIVRKPRSTA